MSVQYLPSYKIVYTDTAVVVHTTAQIVTNIAAFTVMVTYFRDNPTYREDIRFPAPVTGEAGGGCQRQGEISSYPSLNAGPMQMVNSEAEE